jgi:dihydrofolate reductase
MSKITAFVNVTLDGVMQAPGRPDEVRRGDFQHGGWAAPYADEVLGRVAAEGMATTGGILLGRRTYQDFYGYWPKQTDNPFTDVLNTTRGPAAALRLVDTTTTTTGVIVATYQPAEAAPGGPR